MSDPGDGFVMRPHPLFILLRPLGHIAWIGAICLIAVLGVKIWNWAGIGAGVRATAIVQIGVLFILSRLLWAVAEWATRKYGITGGLVWAEYGVLNRRRDELSLSRVQSMSVDRPLLQRLLGLGSVGFATAGTGGFEVVWLLIGKPASRLGEIRGMIGQPEKEA